MIERIIIQGYRLFESFDLQPNAGTNIIVGDNESGKSTLLEALSMALTGRINGRSAADELNPYWFNQGQVEEFFASLRTEAPLAPPEILIELYLTNEEDDLQPLRGVHNSQQAPVPGISIHVFPSHEYAEELKDYFEDLNCPSILPTEWYELEWCDFSDARLVRRPKGLGTSVIDSRTIRSTSGVDYHTREMLTDFVEPKERAAIAVAHRKARHTISVETLETANHRIAAEGAKLHDRTIGLQMDQSANASWESSIVPQVADVPFAMAGQGQQASIKVALAMNRSADKTRFSLIEEPENHLSYTSLTKLVKRIESLSAGRQVFLTTHSSYVLNRLGLDKLVLLYDGNHASFGSLPKDTVRYFKKLAGYDTLRLVLANKVILVEGPADEMIIERAYRDSHQNQTPMDHGIDVISMHGVSLKRGLQLCAALDRKVAAVRDNDDKPPDHWREPLKSWLKPQEREVFIGDPSDGRTLEPQFVKVNDDQALRRLLSVPSAQGTVSWMESHKTEWALRVEESIETVSFPTYITDAIEFIS